MQVVICAHLFVCTLVNALVLQEKTPPAQVAAGDDAHDCKWSIFASWWKEKHHQCKLHSVKTILVTSIGARSLQQPNTCRWHKDKICIKMVPLCKLQLVLVVFFFGALAHLLKCAQTDGHKLELALCGGGGCVFMWW